MVTRSLAGLVPSATGSVTIDGRPMRLGSVPLVWRVTCFLSPTIARLRACSRKSLCWRYRRYPARCLRANGRAVLAGAAPAGRHIAEPVGVDRHRLKWQSITLSGGNQQKLLFGRALASKEAGVLLMNEPTRGIDVGARAEIYRIMRELCDLGAALIMTSSDLEEVVGIADIVITLYRGRVVARYEGDGIAMSSILADITHPTQTIA